MSSYIAHAPVSRTTQSALHSTLWQTRSIAHHASRLLREAYRHAATQKAFCWLVVELPVTLCVVWWQRESFSGVPRAPYA